MNHYMEFLTESGLSFGPRGAAFFGVLGILAVIDIVLKGWGMWRAARMNKQIWFIALLLVNSVGILPAIFLLLTKDEYKKMDAKK